MEVKLLQNHYLEVIDFQLFVVNSVKSGLRIICGFKESEDLTILTCFDVQMCGLDDKMREEKRNKRDAVKRENRMGCCCNDTHSLIWIYRQLYFIVCIYRGVKSSVLRMMVYFE